MTQLLVLEGGDEVVKALLRHALFSGLVHNKKFSRPNFFKSLKYLI